MTSREKIGKENKNCSYIFFIFVGMVLESMRIQESVVNVKKLADVFSCVTKDEDSQ
jgi:hypothetical protein